MKRLFRRTATVEAPSDSARGRVLLADSAGVVIVLDERRRVVAASRRARATVAGLVDGAPLPPTLSGDEREPVEVPYEVDGRRETLVVLGDRSEVAAYEELRIGFTAAVSHELRTPLARLLALLETALLPGADPPELIDRARREVIQIGELIDDVLFLSELEGGREVVAFGPTRTLPVLESVCEELRERADRAGVTLRVACPGAFELPLRQRMLEVVAKNLAENAIRHAGTGATLTLACRSGGGALLLDASDDGVGVGEEELARLFERFFRADAARSSRGTGLGLAIVKHVVVSAGGAVEASPTPGQGLTIRCSFPSGRPGLPRT